MATLDIRINNVVTAMATTDKMLRVMMTGSSTGDLTSLTTTQKTGLVAAINEVKAGVVALQNATSINDSATNTSTTWSSSKIASSIAAKTEINDATSTTTNTLSASKTNANIAAAIAGFTQIDDTLVKTSPNATSRTYSIPKIVDLITASVNQVLNGAPAALDTLKEISDALGGDGNFAATMTTALSNRVRFDAAQTLTATQKATARANIDAYGSTEIGNPDTDFVATYNAGLV